MIHHFRLWAVWLCASSSLWSSACIAEAGDLGAQPGAQQLIEVLDGVPRHRIRVPTFADADAAIRIDGVVDEALWRQVADYDNMLVAVPGTGQPGAYRTELRLLATERGLYVSAVMHQPPETLVQRLSARDDFVDRDILGFTLDPGGEGRFAYWFMVALGGSVLDGKVLPERRFQNDWDGPWRSATARLSYGWSAELMLPWSMLSLPRTQGERTLGFAAARHVTHTNQRYQWPGHSYSSARFVTALNSMQVAGVEPRQQISIIPFASMTKDQARGDDKARFGIDLAWRPSPKLALAATALPDFGAVEADDVVLNLTALETFFPEKRLFFLEGNEVFESTPRANSGNVSRAVTNDNFATTSRKVWRSEFHPPPISLVNTRRMGGTASQVEVPDEAELRRGERDLPTDLLGAAKVTGVAGNLRYGLLGALEDDVEWLGRSGAERVKVSAPGRDFAVARLLYEAVGADRRSVGYIGTLVAGPGPTHDAEVHGLDAHYTSGDGGIVADAQVVRSVVDGEAGYGALVDLRYARSPVVQHQVALDYFDADADLNDLGFLARNDYVGAQYALQYANPGGIGRFKVIRGALVARQEVNLSEGQVVSGGLYWRNSMVLPGRNTVNTALAWLPRRHEDRDSRGNGAYRVRQRWWGDVQLTTDASRALSFSASLGALQENLGDWTHAVAAGATWRPNDRLALDFDLRYKRRRGWVVHAGERNFGTYKGPDLQPSFKFNWVIAPRHQLRLSLQWAGVKAELQDFWAVPEGDGKLIPAQPDDPEQDFSVSILTAQLRYRWEIAPLTDFYLVYNLGNRLPNRPDSDLSGLFSDAFDDPVVESFVAKLRYRFGN